MSETIAKSGMAQITDALARVGLEAVSVDDLSDFPRQRIRVCVEGSEDDRARAKAALDEALPLVEVEVVAQFKSEGETIE